MPSEEGLVPPGFEPFTAPGFALGFDALVGPLYWCRQGDDRRFGLRLEAKHCNMLGFAHGGLMATLADIALAFGIMAKVDRTQIRACLTMSMTLNYLGSGQIGDWVEARAETDKASGGTAFARAMLTAADRPLLNASGLFKLVRVTTPP